MISLVKTYDWLENKVIGNTPIITNIRYANFKMMNFLRSGNNLKCDEKIAEHQKIAAKWMSKRIFVLNLGLRLYPLIALFYLFTAILSPIIYSQNKNFWLVFPLFIPSILVVILIPLQKYRAEVSKR